MESHIPAEAISRESMSQPTDRLCLLEQQDLIPIRESATPVVMPPMPDPTTMTSNSLFDVAVTIRPYPSVTFANR